MRNKSKVILMTLAILCLHLTAFSQNINLKMNDVMVKNAMETLKKEYGYSFIFESGDLNTQKIISIDLRNKTVDDAVKQILKDQDVSYEISNKKIIVKKKKQTEKTSAEIRKISGTIVDENDEPIIGASIIEKEKSTGTLSDINGEFNLNASSKGVLIISYVGYQKQEIAINNQTNIKIVLIEDDKLLDEVVVIGYGTALKRNLVGSVAQIDSKMINERAQMNVASSLQGQLPGLTIAMRDGKPSRGATIDLRGATSIGSGGNPLILIDGVEAHNDLTTINPMDIEKISVLKDASSAAIYGARGAFGVILITTKEAKADKTRVNYTGNVSFQRRLAEYDVVWDGLKFTDKFYEAYVAGQNSIPTTINNVFPYTEAWHTELRNRAANPELDRVRVNDLGQYEYFGNTDWFDIFYKDMTLSTEHNLSISGGSEKAKYYVSGRYYNNNGIYNEGNEDYTSFNFMAKGSLKINQHLTIENKVDFFKRGIHQPMVMYDRQLPIRQIDTEGFPMTIPKNPDGTWTEAAVYVGWVGFVEGSSYQHNNKMDLKNTTTLTYTPLKELIFKGDFSFYYNHSERDRSEGLYEFNTGPEITKSRHNYNSLEYLSNKNEYYASNLTANYLPNLGDKHKLNILGGVNIDSKYNRAVTSYRRGLLYQDKPSFHLMDGTYYKIDQSGEEWSYFGVLYRLNYEFNNRYLAEVSGRYDGSSKFPKGQQWGFFPSMSLAWRLSEESFMSWSKSWLDQFKVRISAGSMGNGNIGTFKYISAMNIAKSSILLDGEQQSYTYAPKNIPLSLTWETSKTYNFGLDIDMLHNRLGFVFDYYQRYVTDMFTPGMEAPAVFGAAVPYGNNADMKTKGWELSLQWRDHFTLAGKPFDYSVKAMLWDSRSWVTKYNNSKKLLGMNQTPNYYEGMEIGEMWGFHVEGLFKDQNDVDNHADQTAIRVSSDNKTLPGDLKYADLNGDGIINTGANTVDDPGDRRIIGNNRPRYNYGFNLSANWNGIGISALIQGVGKQSWYPHRDSQFFWGQYNRPYGFLLEKHLTDNVWNEANQNTDAYWPRYRGYLANSATKSMGYVNDRYLQNVAYIRLKNLQIDYTFNKKVCDFFNISNLRVFAAGENLWTWSPLFKITKNYDPEAIFSGDSDFRNSANTDGDGSGYPMMGSYTFGINVTF